LGPLVVLGEGGVLVNEKSLYPCRSKGCGVQGYLTYKKPPPPQDDHKGVATVLL